MSIHRLRNWELARDMMRTDPDFMANMVTSAFELAGLIHPDRIAVNNMIDSCKLAGSQDGLEVCMVMMRGEIFPDWEKISDEIPEFDKFLKELDNLLEDIKDTVGRSHRLYELPSLEKQK